MNKINNSIIFFATFLFWLLFLGLNGTLFSGYHFADDHTHIEMLQNIQNIGLWETIKYYINADLQIRYRPIYELDFVLRTYIFGDNILIHSIFKYFTFSFATYFLFLFAKKIHFSIVESILFALMVVIGQQTTITYMLGPAEHLAILFFAIALVFMAKSIENIGNNWMYKLLFIFFTILTCLSKESFILIIPSFYLLYIWLVSQKTQQSFFVTLQKNIFIGIILASIVLINLYLLKTIVQETKLSYVGVDNSTNIFSYLKTFAYTLCSNIVGIIFLGYLFFLFITKKIKKDFFYFLLLFSFSLIFTQVILYAKSGIQDRYMIPAILGFTIPILLLFTSLKEDNTTYKLPKVILYFIQITSILLFVLGISIFINYDFRKLLIETLTTFRGKNVGAAVSLFSIQSTIETIKIFGLGIAFISIFILIFSILKQKVLNKFTLYNSFISLIVLAILFNLTIAITYAQRFTFKGKNATFVLNSILENTIKSDTVLVVGDVLGDNEAIGGGIKSYLTIKENYKNVYVFPLALQTGGDDEKMLLGFINNTFENRTINDISNKTSFKVIILFPLIEPIFLKNNTWFKKENYTRKDYNFYTAFIKK